MTRLAQKQELHKLVEEAYDEDAELQEVLQKGG